jgi:hypothetical protein
MEVRAFCESDSIRTMLANSNRVQKNVIGYLLELRIVIRVVTRRESH